MDVKTCSRRGFIKAAGLAAGAALVASLPDLGAARTTGAEPGATTARLFGRHYRGTADGFILESSDGGLSWQRVAKFGSHCSILSLHEHQGLAHARVEVGSHRFALTSTDARSWRCAAVARA